MSAHPPVSRVGVLFSGGPAPAANAVIGAAVTSLRRRGVEVVGLLHGYTGLLLDPSEGPLEEGEHYHLFEDRDLWGLRNERGIVIGTARRSPGRDIERIADFDDPVKTRSLRVVHQRMLELGLDALVSIGGDGTLQTANILFEFQKRLPADTKRVKVVHLPKTIDNDYHGIDFTFGFFTAVDVIARELRNLRADAMATQSYFIAETMGRRAGWLAYGVALAGEAHLVVGVEDVVGDLAVTRIVLDAHADQPRQETRLDVDALARRIVDLILVREARGKRYGTVVLAEGLAELLPEPVKKQAESGAADEPLSFAKLDIGRLVAAKVAQEYQRRTGNKKKITGVQLGYESRCSAPHAFDVLLGSQLGLGACRALVDLGLDGHMVSVRRQLELHFLPFSELVNPETLRTDVRYIERGSDFHLLAHELSTRIPGRSVARPEAAPKGVERLSSETAARP
jgi:6-phosphofructokinase 1